MAFCYGIPNRLIKKAEQWFIYFNLVLFSVNQLFNLFRTLFVFVFPLIDFNSLSSVS